MYISGTINGQEHNCLLDTGSDVNLMPASVAQDLTIETVSRKILAANGSDIPLKGRVTVSTEFSWGQRQDVSFLVLDQVKK